MKFKKYKSILKKEITVVGNNIVLTYFNLLIKPNKIELFLLLLRTAEFLKNRSGIYKLIYFFVKYQKWKLGVRLGFTIPEHVFEEGLQIPHYGTIVVNANARVGRNCRLHACTNIGSSSGSSVAPKIGDNVYIGPGVKIYGGIFIANNTTLAANAAVAESVLHENCLVGGVPAKVIKHYDNKALLKIRE